MHGGGGKSGGRKRARIEIIPLIDVIFFLLATFVLFTLSLNQTKGVPVQLPVSSTSHPRDPSGAVTLTVTAEGSIAWDKELITLDEFIGRIKQYGLTEGADARVLINADERTLFGNVVYVVDQVRISGIPKIYVETRVAQAAQTR
ncbi:MAG TPA: biopolymer transporter ExbD [Opitutaceae bacterium]|nr:biopolymer transporter ExbD [Opitutaceae bacterium]